MQTDGRGVEMSDNWSGMTLMIVIVIGNGGLRDSWIPLPALLCFLTVQLPSAILPVEEKTFSAVCCLFYGPGLRGQILLCWR